MSNTTPTREASEVLAVTQADREAAAAMFPTYAISILSGSMDETENVQAFARHRIEALASISPTPPAVGEEARFADTAMGRAIIQLRHAGAANFTDDQHQGQRGADWDNGLIATFLAAEKAYLATLRPSPDAIREAFNAGYHCGHHDGSSLSDRNWWPDSAWESYAALSNEGRKSEEGGCFWLIVHEPGMVPDRKGPWPLRDQVRILREFIAARPNAYLTVLWVGDDGVPEVQHGPEALQMADGRSMGVGRKHNARTLAAHTRTALATPEDRTTDKGEGR